MKYLPTYLPTYLATYRFTVRTSLDTQSATSLPITQGRDTLDQRRLVWRLTWMSVSIPADATLGVEAKEYSIVNGCIQNVRLWPGKDGRTYFGLRSDTGSGSAETIDEFMLRVPRDVAALRVRSPRPQTALV